jgi:phage terminase Nu1 subunit (DNA packaging protein)
MANPIPEGFPKRLSNRSMGLILGVTHGTISSWIQKEDAPENDDGSISAKVFMKWVLEREYKKGIKAGEKLAHKDAESGEFDPNNDWDQRLKKAKALREELRLDEDRKTFAKVDVVKTAWVRALRTLRSALGAIPKTMAATLVGKKQEEIYEALDTAITDTLQQCRETYSEESKQWANEEEIDE